VPSRGIVAKRGKASLGGFTCCFVVNDIPVFDETSILQADEVHHSLWENDFRRLEVGFRNALSAWQARHSKNAVEANSTTSLFWICWRFVLIENAAF